MPPGCPIGTTKSLTVDSIQRVQMNFSLDLEYYLEHSKGFDLGLFFPLKSYIPLTSSSHTRGTTKAIQNLLLGI